MASTMYSPIAQGNSMLRSKVALSSVQRVTTVRSRTIKVAATARVDAVPFSPDVAVVMGEASFAAYLEPAHDCGWKHKSKNFTETRFFDSDFVAEVYAGVLEVTVHRARDLCDQDYTRQSDPFVIASCAGAYAKTTTRDSTLNPVWEEVFHLWIKKGREGSNVVFNVVDNDYLRNEDDPLGSASIPFNECINVEKESDVKLKGGPRGNKGYLNISTSWTPFGWKGGNEAQAILDKVDEDVEVQVAEDAPQVAQEMGRALSKAGPQSDPELRAAWNSMCKVYDKKVVTDKRTIAFIEQSSTGTQLWVYRDMGLKKVILAFRGTESTKMADLVVDVNLRYSEVFVENSVHGPLGADGKPTSFLENMTGTGDTPTAHGGFYGSFESIRDRVLEVTDELTGGDPSWQVYATGHSLGGALAILAAFALTTRKNGPNYNVSMYNYGGPRVGNQMFVDLYTIKDTWRVANEEDVVAKMPVAGLFGFRHVPGGVRMLKDGSYVFTDVPAVVEREVEKKGLASWWPFSMFAPATETDRSLDASVDTSVDEYDASDGNVLASIASKRGIVAHMEDCYVEGLCAMTSETNPEGLADEVAENLSKYRNRAAVAKA